MAEVVASSLSFGGDLSSNEYYYANTRANTGGQSTVIQRVSNVCPAGTAKKVATYAQSGDGTADFDIHVEGAVDTTISNADSGVEVHDIDIALSALDEMNMQWVSGTDVADITFTLSIEVSGNLVFCDYWGGFWDELNGAEHHATQSHGGDHTIFGFHRSLTGGCQPAQTAGDAYIGTTDGDSTTDLDMYENNSVAQSFTNIGANEQQLTHSNTYSAGGQMQWEVTGGTQPGYTVLNTLVDTGTGSNVAQTMWGSTDFRTGEEGDYMATYHSTQATTITALSNLSYNPVLYADSTLDRIFFSNDGADATTDFDIIVEGAVDTSLSNIGADSGIVIDVSSAGHSAGDRVAVSWTSGNEPLDIAFRLTLLAEAAAEASSPEAMMMMGIG